MTKKNNKVAVEIDTTENFKAGYKAGEQDARRAVFNTLFADEIQTLLNLIFKKEGAGLSQGHRDGMLHALKILRNRNV